MSRARHTAAPLGRSARLELLDALRGIAALSLVFFHVAATWPAFHASPSVVRLALYGQGSRGTFFVISGFIIPLTMFWAGYQHRDAGRFMLRRVVRLYPAYLLVTVSIYALNLAVATLRGLPHPSLFQLALHATLLNDILGVPWVSPVFWTLAIEFQYYVLIAAIFPLLMSETRVIRIAPLAGMVIAPWFLGNHHLVFDFLPMFALGFWTFRFCIGHLSRNSFLLGIIPLVAAAALSQGALFGFAALATSLCIAFVRPNAAFPLKSLGRVSYSLYLVHWPVANNIMIQTAKRTDDLSLHVLAIGGAIIASIAAAYCLYSLVEMPSHRLARRIRANSKVS